MGVLFSFDYSRSKVDYNFNSLIHTAWWWRSMQTGRLQSRCDRESSTLSSPWGWSACEAGSIQTVFWQRSKTTIVIHSWCSTWIHARNVLRPNNRAGYGWIRTRAAAATQCRWYRLGKHLNCCLSREILFVTMIISS